LLDAAVNAETRARYASAVHVFLAFVQDHHDRIEDAADLEYWLSCYAHSAYVTGHPHNGQVATAISGVEHWMPEFKPLPLVRRCLCGWGRLAPPSPAAPMPRELGIAVAATACLAGDVAAGVAMLVSMDCWLRISEVSGLTADAVVDLRGSLDPVMRGVSVYLPTAKTGSRQAVRVESPEVAAILAAWATATRGTGGGRLFPSPEGLRAALARALRLLGADDPSWQTRGLAFVWHSFRHGGASRAYLSGVELPAILIRGRWAVESSGRHYAQAGRQMLLATALPAHVSTLARRVEVQGLCALLAPDVRARLRR